MLGKLIKHDFRSLSRVLLPTQLAVLGAGILFTLGISFNIHMDSNFVNQSAFGDLLRIITIFISALMILGICAAFILVAFIIYQRFYKSIMCDEGYLTFTLPVTTAEILWSKLITATLWTLISLVTIFVSVNIFILFGTSRSFINLELYRGLGQMIADVTARIGLRWLWPVFLAGAFTLAATVSGILHVYLSLILGSVVSQKHKLLAAIGFYFAINLVQGILMMVIQFLSMDSMLRRMDMLNGIQWKNNALQIYSGFMRGISPYLWSNMIFLALISVGFFLLCHYFLKNKLNLE